MMNVDILHLLKRAMAAVFLAATMTWALPASAQSVKNIYNVSGVPIDATASSASVAKAQALAEGRQVAFRRLVNRLTLPEELQARGGLPAVAPDVLERLIASYSVADEKSSTVRYLARLSVDFDANAVKGWLRTLGVTPIDSRSLPLAVFPFAPNTPEPERIALNNAWRAGGFESELVPLGLSTVAASTNEFPAYEAAAKSAGAGGALLATVQVVENSSQYSATIKLTKLEGGARFEMGTAQASVPAPANDAARATVIQNLMDKTVLAASDLVQLEWKRRAVVRGGQTATVAMTAEYSSLEEWNAIRSALGHSTLIRNVRVEAISKDGALLSVSYSGSEAQLQTDVAQARLSLENSDEGYILRSMQ